MRNTVIALAAAATIAGLAVSAPRTAHAICFGCDAAPGAPQGPVGGPVGGGAAYPYGAYYGYGPSYYYALRPGITVRAQGAIGTISGCGTDILGRFKGYRPATEAGELGQRALFATLGALRRAEVDRGPERTLPDRWLPFMLSLV
jgi:hypothetical protein